MAFHPMRFTLPTDVATGNGGLLPHLFTFTSPARPKLEIYSLWHFLAISVSPKPPPLSQSMVPCVVRTFLSDSYRSDKAACCEGKIKVKIRAIPFGSGFPLIAPIPSGAIRFNPYRGACR